MSYRSRLVLESLTAASILAVISIVAGFIGYLVDSGIEMLTTATAILFVAFAIMLILGGCMMAREPLDDAKKYDADGKPVAAWRITLIGRKILLAGVFTFVFSFLFFILDFVI